MEPPSDVLEAAEALLAQSIPTTPTAFVPLTESARTAAAASSSPFALREDTVFSEPPAAAPAAQSDPFTTLPPSPAEQFATQKLQGAVQELHKAVVRDYISDMYDNPGTLPTSTVISLPAPSSTLPPSFPALPGSPSSPFRRCPCLGVLPGRACPRCGATHWVKLCPKCDGKGTISVTVRKGAVDRVDKCGFCMGAGSVPAQVQEVAEATAAAQAAMASLPPTPQYDPGEGPDEDAKPVIRRHPQLPGMKSSSPSKKSKKAKSKQKSVTSSSSTLAARHAHS